MTNEERDYWKARTQTVHVKQGRMLITAIVHVDGPDAPPMEALFLAATHWAPNPGGQAVRRPDENGKQVYWVNVVNTAPQA